MAPTRNSSLRNVGSNYLTTYDLLHGLLKESVFAGRNGDSRDLYDLPGNKKNKTTTGLDGKNRKITNSKEEILGDVKSDKAKRLANLIQQLLRYVSMTMKKQNIDRQRLDAKIKKESSKIECLYNVKNKKPFPSSRLSEENIRKISRPVEKPRSKIEISRRYSDREKGGGCSNGENPDKPVLEQRKRFKSSRKYYVDDVDEEIIPPRTRKHPKPTSEILEPCSIGKISHKYSTKERSHDSHNSRNSRNCAETTSNKLAKVTSACKKRSGTEFKVWEGRGSDHAARRASERREECAEGLCNCCYRCECPKFHRKEQDGELGTRSFVEEIDGEERELLEREEKRRKSEKKKSLDQEIFSERRSSEKKRRISSEKKLTPERKMPLDKSDRMPYDNEKSPETKIPSEKRKSSERPRSHEKRISPKRKVSTPEKQLSDESTTLKKRRADQDDRQETKRSLDKRSSPGKGISKDESDDHRRRKRDTRIVPEERRRKNKECSQEKHSKAKPKDGYISEDATEKRRHKKEKERHESDRSIRRHTIVDEIDEEQPQYSDDLEKNYADDWESDRPSKPKVIEPRTRRLSPENIRPRVYLEERHAEDEVWRSSKLSTIEEEQKSISKKKPKSIQPRISTRTLQRDGSCPFITHEKSLISSSYIDICNQYADSVADACVTEYDDAIHQICREFLEVTSATGDIFRL